MAERPTALLRNLFVICLSGAGWAFGFGLGMPLAGFWLNDAAASGNLPGFAFARSHFNLGTLIGLSTGIYYLGTMIAAGQVPVLMRRWGRGCLALGMALSGAMLTWLPWADSIGAFYLIRFAGGVGGALSLIALETLVNRYSSPSQRARNFGLYAIAVALGWAGGNLAGLQMYHDTPRLAFVLGGLVSGVAGIVIWFGLTWRVEPKQDSPIRPKIPFRANFLCFGSSWVQGFLEGGMEGLLALYLLSIGLATNEVSWLTSGILIGAIVFQLPVALLADRYGRSAILGACYAATALGLACLPFCSAASIWLRVWLLVVGACSATFYPLGLAVLGERLPEGSLPRANAWFLAINCFGCLIGPVAAGNAMDHWTGSALFFAGEAAVVLTFVLWLATRWRSRRDHDSSTAHVWHNESMAPDKAEYPPEAA